MNIRRRGDADATGIVKMAPHPDYTRGRAELEAIPVGHFDGVKHADVEIAGTATVEMQATNGNPAVADNWRTVGSIGTTGQMSTDEPWQFIRFNIPSLTAGATVEIRFSAITQ